MHDLRKQALLESGKTVSRKARSKTGSASSSKPGSRANSRPSTRGGSRNVSDDEGEMSDTTQWSTNSIDELVADAADNDLPSEHWIADLEDRINEICDRKRSSAQGREECLQTFNLDLTRHYAIEELKPKTDALLPAVLKSVKSGATERETVLALKALALMLITVPSETIYDTVAGPIKTTATDATHPIAKIAAIRALSIATFYGGATIEETENVMEFFLDIASSDGGAVGEVDNAEIVVAAIEEWGFLATQLEDMEETTEVAMETFVDQLDSVDAHVKIAAGDNIALLFEKSYTEAESDEEPEDDDAANTSESEIAPDTGERMIKRYTVYRQRHQLEQTLEGLAKASTKRVSKKDRKALHLTFTDILNTVERPTRGPRYSTALDEEGRELGSRLKISVHGGGKMTIDKWWKLHRLNALKRLLQGGFGVHYELNPVVFDSLPINVEDD
ncbi:interferon-related developmental regulator-domain-containing protein [Neohortaea acidophila]|uniref:Interferon-related developmental regulator-domain-containing protein n=1 Tax=Neohortaea acidophila TaxID=245834 RepID=A0A6A6PZU2_9PEZI|nr:interferon-related developmental regulator-domain-containing protein [Neohortaea acidophila]KAF2485291.1 interferon-related developmental regulator-domain-containing protein [Neohortaea acidophila]